MHAEIDGYLGALLATEGEPLALLVKEALDPIVRTMNRRNANLSAIEFHYVVGMINQYRGIPFNMRVLAEQIDAYAFGQSDLKKKVVTGDIALLLLGFFNPRGTGFYRRRSSYSLSYYEKIARRCYWDVSELTGKRLYSSLGHNFPEWVQALSALARHLKEESLESYLVNQQTAN